MLFSNGQTKQVTKFSLQTSKTIAKYVISNATQEEQAELLDNHPSPRIEENDN